MRKLVILLAASTAAVIAMPASAATEIANLGVIVVPPTQTFSPGITFGASGANTGLYQFTVSQNNTQVTSSFTNSAIGSTGLFSFQTIGLYSGLGTSGTLLQSGTVGATNGFQFAALNPYTLTAGTYTVAYTGTATGAPAGVGSNFVFSAAAVPEPASWLMMIAGVGMVGFGLRRRNSNVKTTVSFA